MTEPDLDRFCPEPLPGLRLLPVIHERIESAMMVRSVLEILDPAVVAVELPTPLEELTERAVVRLPRISFLVAEEPETEALAWLVVPGDPLVEALRWARERDRPRLYIDPDVLYLERNRDPVPDPYAFWSLGADGYLSRLVGAMAGEPAGEADRLRESGMAHVLRERLEDGPEGTVLALVGAAHLRSLETRLTRPTAAPFARQRRGETGLYNVHPESLTGVLADPPLAHAVWELLRTGDPAPETPLEATVQRKISLVSGGLRLVSREATDPTDRSRRLVEHAAGSAGRTVAAGVRGPDRRRLSRVVWEAAARSYREQTDEEVAPWQRRLFFDYLHRLVRIGGHLAPGLYEWVTGGRGVGDDNLAWEVFDVGRAYPWQEEGAEIPTARVDGELLDLGTRKIRFRRRFFRVKRRPVRVPVKEHLAAPDDPREWLEGFTGGLCSFPPEDVVVEDYGRYLREKAVSILSTERKRSEPFSGSMLDGIDIRETLRHLAEGEIWVQEHRRAPGEAGSVIVIFDRDRGSSPRFPYRMSWLGEHDQESDMA
ncbi:MAG: hypothetical protein R3234_01055, partial [Thermoanaerobaculia bacterium]|nr:hypothetical protein [Thermoanaerobaculia bacterium]